MMLPNKNKIKINAVGREGVGPSLLACPYGHVGWMGRLSASYSPPCFCGWLLSFQISVGTQYFVDCVYCVQENFDKRDNLGGKKYLSGTILHAI
jgi:hypothetical protein